MTQFRADEGLAFILQYENVAWYDAGEVKILDRRIYPAKIEFVRCKTHGEVMQAIRDMVTQSAGPYTAAAMGMAGDSVYRIKVAERNIRTFAEHLMDTGRLAQRARDGIIQYIRADRA